MDLSSGYDGSIGLSRRHVLLYIADVAPAVSVGPGILRLRRFPRQIALSVSITDSVMTRVANGINTGSQGNDIVLVTEN